MVDRIGWVEVATDVGRIGRGWLFGKRRESDQEKMKNGRNPARKFWKTVKIWLDLAKSSEILAIFGKI